MQPTMRLSAAMSFGHQGSGRLTGVPVQWCGPQGPSQSGMAGFVPSVRFGFVLVLTGLTVFSCTCGGWALLAGGVGGAPVTLDAWRLVVVKAAHARPAEARCRKTLLTILKPPPEKHLHSRQRLPGHPASTAVRRALSSARNWAACKGRARTRSSACSRFTACRAHRETYSRRDGVVAVSREGEGPTYSAGTAHRLQTARG